MRNIKKQEMTQISGRGGRKVNGGVSHFREKNSRKKRENDRRRERENKEKRDGRAWSDLEGSRGSAEGMKDT